MSGRNYRELHQRGLDLIKGILYIGLAGLASCALILASVGVSRTYLTQSTTSVSSSVLFSSGNSISIRDSVVATVSYSQFGHLAQFSIPAIGLYCNATDVISFILPLVPSIAFEELLFVTNGGVPGLGVFSVSSSSARSTVYSLNTMVTNLSTSVGFETGYFSNGTCGWSSPFTLAFSV